MAEGNPPVPGRLGILSVANGQPGSGIPLRGRGREGVRVPAASAGAVPGVTFFCAGAETAAPRPVLGAGLVERELSAPQRCAQRTGCNKAQPSEVMRPSQDCPESEMCPQPNSFVSSKARAFRPPAA